MKTIKIAQVFIRLCVLMVGVGLLLIILILLMSILNPIWLKDFISNHLADLSIVTFSFKDINGVRLHELSLGMKVWLLVCNMVYCGLILLSLVTIQKILNNISQAETFYQNNIKYFQDLAKYATILAIIGAIDFSYLNSAFQLTLSLPIKTIGLAIGFLVLAEIFKQGRLLYDENKAII